MLGLVGVIGLDDMISHAVEVSGLVLVRVVVGVIIFARSLLSGGGVIVAGCGGGVVGLAAISASAD